MQATWLQAPACGAIRFIAPPDLPDERIVNQVMEGHTVLQLLNRAAGTPTFDQLIIFNKEPDHGA